MTNARSIISQAARKIAVLGRGQVMPAEEYQDALQCLNTMLGTMSTDVGLIFNNVRETFSLNGAVSYTIGVGGDFNTIKPVLIQSAYIRNGAVDYPLSQMDADAYAAIGFKSLTGIPEQFYFENNTPLGRLFIYPIGNSYTVTLFSLKPLDSFADLTTDYDLPPGVEDMLVFNLAVNLAPEYEREAPATVKKLASDSISSMQAYNKRNNYPKSAIDMVGTHGVSGNILSGYYVR